MQISFSRGFSISQWPFMLHYTVIYPGCQQNMEGKSKTLSGSVSILWSKSSVNKQGATIGQVVLTID